jgi:hypothetical protein
VSRDSWADPRLFDCSRIWNKIDNLFGHVFATGRLGYVTAMTIDQVVLSVQRFARRWPDIKRFPGDTEQAENDTDGGFERLLRASLEEVGLPGDVALARELHYHDNRHGAMVSQHELDIVLRLEDGPCVIESKAWSDTVDKDAIIILLAKVLDFIAAPKFDATADSIRVGFIGLAGFTEAARRIMFAFGVIPFSRNGADLSFRFLELQLAELGRHAEGIGATESDRIKVAREIITPFVAYESRLLTTVVRMEGDQCVVDLASIRRGAELYDESRAAHSFALDVYRAGVKRFG